MSEQPEHLTTTEARAGNRSPVNRHVLWISLAMVVVAFGALLLLFAHG